MRNSMDLAMKKHGMLICSEKKPYVPFCNNHKLSRRQFLEIRILDNDFLFVLQALDEVLYERQYAKGSPLSVSILQI